MAGLRHPTEWVLKMIIDRQRFSFFTLAIIFAAVSGSASAEIVAKVTDLGIPGKAVIESTDQSRSIDFLDKLELGQQVSIAAAGELTLVYFASGVEYQYSGPARFIMGQKKPENIEGQPRRVKDYKLLEKTGLKLTVDQKHRDQAALSLRSIDINPDKIRQLSPNKTKLLGASPVFTWASIGDDVNYDFSLTDSYGKVEYTASVADNKLELPEEITLKADRKYSWRVSAIHTDSEHVGSADFELGSQSLVDSLSITRPNITSSFSEQVVYALLLEQEGFKYAAQQHWQRMAKARPADSGISAKLAELDK